MNVTSRSLAYHLALQRVANNQLQTLHERRVLNVMIKTHIGEYNLGKTYAPINKRYLKNKTSHNEGYNTQMHNHHVHALTTMSSDSEVLKPWRTRQSPSMPMSSKVAEHGQSSFDCICIILTLRMSAGLRRLWDTCAHVTLMSWCSLTCTSTGTADSTETDSQWLAFLSNDTKTVGTSWTILASWQNTMLTHWTSWILTCAVNNNDSSFTRGTWNEEAKFDLMHSWRTQIVILRL